MRASTNPLAYCEGGFYGGHLGIHDKIKPILKSATASFGITALNELQQLYNKKSLVEDGEFAVKVMEYINCKVNQFKETLVGIAQSSFNQDFLKSMVDSGIRVLNVFDDLSPSLSFILEQFATLLELVTKIADFAGGIPLLIGGIGLKNIGSPKMFGLVLNLPIIICVL